MNMRYSLNTKVVFNEGTDEEIISYWGPSPRAWAIRWLYENIRRNSITSLSDLSDVGDGTPLDGQVLVYDGTDGEWGFGDAPSAGDANVQSDWNETDALSDAFILNKPTLFSGDYNDLINAPTIFGGSYNDLTDLPDLFDGDYNSLTNAPNLFDGDYNNLTNTPTIPQAINDLTDVDTSAGPADGDTLIWVAANNSWEPGVGVTNITNVGDITINNPQDGQVLVYDIQLGDWVNTTINAGPQAINDLTDVDTATVAPTDGQVLTWNQVNSEWEPATVAAGSVTSINDIGDVDSSSEQDGDVLSWNATTNNWENGPLEINDLSNVDANPTDGQVLTWSFANLQWEASTVATGSVTSIDDIGDVSSSNEQDGDVLSWNPSTNNWENGPLELNDLSNVDTAPTDGQVLSWDNANSQWEATTVDTSVTSLEDVGDVTLTSVGDGDVLSWDTATGDWINIDSSTFGPQSINDLNDVDTATTAPQDGQVLTWNNANQEWEPQSAGGNGEVNVQSDWNETNNTADSFILNKPTLFDGDYNSLTNQPTLFDGNYNSLSNLPTLFDGNYNSLTNLPTLFDGDYNSLTNTPTIPAGINDLNDVDTATAAPTSGQVLQWDGTSNWIPATISGGSGEANVQVDWNETDSADDAFILNKPSIPLVIGDLNDVDTTTTAPQAGQMLVYNGANWIPIELQNIYNVDGTINEDRLVDVEGDFSFDIAAYNNTDNSWANKGFFTLTSELVELGTWESSDGGATLSSDTRFTVEPGSATFTSTSGNTGGIEYAQDYSGGFSNRSLVDKGYADLARGATVNSVPTAERFVISAGTATSNVLNATTAATSSTAADLLGFATATGMTTAVRNGAVASTDIAGSPAIGATVYLSSTVAGQMTTSNASGVQVGIITAGVTNDWTVLLSL